MNLESNKPLIIVISGTYGVGKTTLAHILGYKLNIHQRVGLGVISKTLRYIDHSNPIISKWGDFSDCNNEKDVVKKLHLESELIGNILKSIIDKAFRTGEPYIIDGVQLLPQYLPLEKLHYLTLTVRNEEEHKDRFMNPNITKKKHLNNANFDIVKIVGNEILKNANKHNAPIFESDMPKKDLANLIINKLNIKPIK